jgi:archaellum biogenesis protein FlaJ (TadC family)
VDAAALHFLISFNALSTCSHLISSCSPSTFSQVITLSQLFSLFNSFSICFLTTFLIFSLSVTSFLSQHQLYSSHPQCPALS